MVKQKNPFIIYGYAGPEYFCDREEETKKLVSALTNGRNVTLMSPRRMGKTGLILNAFHKLSVSEPEVKCFYMDIFSTSSLAEFTQLFAQTVLGQLDTAGEKWINRMIEFFKSCRPVISTDPVSGTPSVTLDFVPSNAANTLKEIFAYIKQSGRECVIAIDEFQQIAEYGEKGTEALLRSYIQFMHNAHFIFSGSKRRMMSDMFSLPNRPFYQSTQKMMIGTIERSKYFNFAKKHLTAKGITVAREVFDYFYDLLYGHTWYVQRVLNKIYEECSGAVTMDDMNYILNSIIDEEEYNYQRQYSLLTLNQQKLIKAIAMEKTVAQIGSAKFLHKYGLGASSSVRRSLDYLEDNEFVTDTADGYMTYDHFFAIWLRRSLP